ncbi:MAG: hypothetical protein ACTSX9_02430 [Candidatus Njordarchaeales archaeon]
MPFTPFHLGPALLIGLLFFPFLDIFALCLGSVILDLEPLYYLLFTYKGPYHGLFHTFLGATVAGVFLSIILYPLRRYYLWLVKLFKLEQSTSFRKILVSSLIGTYSHVILDMFLYPEMKPLYPILTNPFLNMLPSVTIYEICIVGFLVAVPLYIIRIIIRIIKR